MCSWKKEEWRPTFWKLWNNRVQLKIRNKELYLSLVLKHHSYIRSDVSLRRASECECGGIWYHAHCLFSLKIWWFLIGFYGLEILIHHILKLYVEQPRVTYAYEICFLYKWTWKLSSAENTEEFANFYPWRNPCIYQVSSHLSQAFNCLSLALLWISSFISSITFVFST